MIDNIERNILFKVAHGFSWLIVFIASISLLLSIIYLINSLPEFCGGGTDVSKEEITAALAQAGKGKKYQVKDINDLNVDIDRINELNSEITKIVLLFPDDIQKLLGEEDIESNRKHFNNRLSFWSNIDDRISIVRDLRSELDGYSDKVEEIMAAVDKYIDLKIEKERVLESKKSEALIKVGSAVGGIITMLILITLITLSLVLMAIEKNTRRPNE